MEKTFGELLERYKLGRMTKAEGEAFSQMLLSGNYRPELEELLDKSWEEVADLSDPETLELIYRNIQLSKEETNQVYVMGQKNKVAWWKYAAAAVIIIMVGAASYFVINRDTPENVIVQAPVTDVKAPETNRAMITLASGEKIFLDSAGSGHLATEGQMKLVKLANGEIAYQSADGTISQELIYNTLSNPRGSKVAAITLSDGSKVWLNAGSSLTYPVAFVSNERKVSITGEAYFEVARSVTASGAKQSFLVDANGVVTEVLGTQFNVNAYEDESDIKVTLLEGSVLVRNQQAGVKIQPGQQAIVTSNQKPVTRNSIDLDAVMAWKNGLFSFSNADVPTVMRELARWYDVEVVYAGKIPPGRYKGEIPRDLTLSQLLNGLSSTRLHFDVKGNKITIYPQ